MYKILQININVNKGSTGKIVEQIGELIIEEGWQSYVAVSAFGKPHPSKSSKYIIGSKFDYYEHAIETLIFDNHGLASRRSTRNLIHFIESTRPDVIHIHNVHGYYLNYKYLFEYLATLRKPVVWTLHDCWSITGHCAHYVKAGCNKWMSGCCDCPLKKDYPASWFVDNSRRNWEQKRQSFLSLDNITIVPISNWLDRQIKQSFLHNLPTTIIHNGIDLSIIKPTKSDLRNKLGLLDKYVILGVANSWYADKGLNDYIKLSGLLPSKYRIILIGLTKHQIRRMPKSIMCFERTASQEELAMFYTMADVLMSLSYGESMGLTILEGMACGTPAIVYNNTAQVDLVSEETGLCVETGNTEATIDALSIMMRRGKSYYSKSCIDYARSNFDKNTSYKKYIDLYKKLLNNESINSNNLL